MVKRKKLEAPSPADLEKFETEFRRETTPRPMAPISHVVAEGAAEAPVLDVETRATQARDQADAAAHRDAVAENRVIADLPTAEINADALIRDRLDLDREALEELMTSIAKSGLRMPVEVFATADGQGAHPYGLLSGYRRLLAVRALAERTQQEKYQRIRALIRPRTDAPEAYATMVEENEIRAALTPFERGRIAVIAAEQGAFANVEAAVGALFPAASKAKRSKIRSFALVFEELGDVIEYPHALTERRGLALSEALRRGGEQALREALTDPAPNPEAEWTLLADAIEAMASPRHVRRGGRPAVRPVAGWTRPDTIHTSSGFVIRRETDSRGHLIRLEGRAVDAEIIENAMLEIQRLLEE